LKLNIFENSVTVSLKHCRWIKCFWSTTKSWK